MLVFTGVIVLSVPGETKGGGGVPVRNHIKVSDVSETNKAGGFLYSDWLRPDATAANQQDVPVTFGSFVLSRSLLASVYGEVKNEWRQILQDNLGLQTAQGWLADTIADGQIGLADKWQHSSQEIYLQLAQATTDSVLGVMAAGAEERAIVIRSVDWDLQLPVGDKDFQLGVNFLGPLHEKPDEAFLWQLRSYAGQNRTKGGNFGLIYRQARKGMFADDEAMYGGNAFLDYESGDKGDFWRWSLGVEYRSELLALYGNRYLALTDGEIQEDEYVYSADGYDVEAAWQFPEHPNVSGFVGYYLWKGENGDDDLKGIRYGTRLSFGEDGAQVELEFDSPEGSSKVKWGLQMSYLHKFGVPTSGAVETAERQFDPRNYFYDAVEREYAQKIRRSSGGGGWQAAVVGLTGNAATLQAQLSNDKALAILVGEKELPYSFNMLVNTTLAIGTDIGASVLGDRDSFAMDLSTDLAVGSVTVSFIDEGRQLRLFPGAKVSLYHNGRRKPNIEYMVAAISMTLSPQQEQTDLQAWVGDDALAVSLYEGAVAFAQNNAASVLVLGREAEARVWTMDGVTVVGGCGSGKERKNFVDDNGVAINAKTYCAPIVLEPVGAITVNADLPSPILLANISASGGSGNYRYSVVAGADFSFQGADLFLSPPNNIFYFLTATVEVSDDTGVSPPGTLVVTVERATEAIMEKSSDYYYTVAHMEGRVIVTLLPGAGRPPYSFVLEDRAGEFELIADGTSAELRISAVAGPALFTVTVKIDDQDISQGAIERIFTVEVLPPIVLEPVGAITVNADLPSSILLTNISASGGSGNYRYSVVAGADFSFQGADLFLSPPNNIFYLLTATVEVSDDTGVSAPGTLVVTVARAIEAITENSSGYYRVAHLEGRIIATLSPDAGRAPYSFVLEDGAGVFTLVAATDDLSAELQISAVAGPALFTVTVKIDDQDINQGAIDSVFTVEVLPPIVLEPVGTITVNAGLSPPILLTNISASGGSGIYRYSVVAGADFSFQGADLFLSPPSNFNLLTVTVEVSDGTGVSTPVLLVVTVVRAVGAIMANLSRASYTVAHLEGRIIETLSPVAGSPPYSFVLRDEAGEFGLATVGASAELRISAVAGPALFTATVEIKDTNQGAIDRIFTVTVLPPVAAQVVNVRRLIHNGFTGIVATLMPFGGNGSYEYRKIADATKSFSVHDSNGVLSIAEVNAVGTQILQVTVEVRDTFRTARMATVAVTVTVAGLSFSPLTVTSGVLATGNILIDHFAEIDSVSGCAGGAKGKIGEITGDLPATKNNNDIRDSFDSGRYGITVSVNLAGSYIYVITSYVDCGGKADLSFSGAYRLDVANGNSEVFVPLQELPANRTYTEDLEFRPPVFYIPPLNYTLVAGGEYRNNKDDAALFTMDDVNGMLMVSGGDERDGLYNNPYVLSVEISDSASQRLTTAVSVVLISLLVRATEADLLSVGINGVTATGEFIASSETETNNLSATEDFEILAKSRGGVKIELVAGSTLALKSDDGSFVFVLDKESGALAWEFLDISGDFTAYTFPDLPIGRSGEQVISGLRFDGVANKYLSSSVWYCDGLLNECASLSPAALSLR